MRAVYLIFSFSIYFSSVFGYISDVAEKQKLITTQKFMIWPNATVPFYVNPEHFDHEQSLKILTALSMFAFKTCLKFAPVMALPSSKEHVMTFVNPTGVKRCVFDTQGHSFYEPHLVTLGYDCLKTPHLEMIIMKALGFPFEHNRANRDQYIDVMLDNVDPGSTDMFIKDINQPAELRIIPYDVNSVMHFGNREFSKNGHRTIIFKDPYVYQNRDGLTATDIRKFDIVYGPECLKRDRQEKIELCQSYPGVARRKRETEHKDEDKKEEVEKTELDPNIVTKSLRVNPHITPPPQDISDVTETLKELGIEDQVQKIVESVFKVSETALSNARTKYCKAEKTSARTQDEGEEGTDILGIINLVSDYAKGMVDKAVANITEFCEGSKSMAAYMRARCDWRPYDPRCTGTFKSTKHGLIRWSTQHRPIMLQSTKHAVDSKKHIYLPLSLRVNNDTAVSDGEVTNGENVESTVNEEIGTTEKMEVEKSALRIGGTGPPHTKKRSGRKHRSVIKKEYKRAHPGHPSKKAQQQEQTASINDSEENENDSLNKDAIDIHIQSNEDTDFKPKARSSESDNEEGEILKSEELNEMVPYNVVKHNDNGKIAPLNDISIQNSRFKIKKPKKIKESGNDRQNKMKIRDSAVKFDTEERENRDSNQHREIVDESKMIVHDKDYSEDRYPIKKQKRGQKKIKERELEEDEPKMIVIKSDLIEDRNAVEEPKRNKGYSGSVASNRDPEPLEKRAELPVPKTITLTKPNREFYKDRKWPGGLVRYVLKTGLGYDLNDLRRRIEEVNTILKERTCVRLKEISEQESEKIEDFLLIDNSPDYVTGRVGGKQNFGSVELLQGGQHRQHTAMMIMAMLGFYFEVSRHDRDKYIRVHMRHVRADKLHHFEMIRSDATLAVPYDYKSATHPAWQFWRQYGRSGISTVATYKETDPDGKIMKSLGQHDQLLSETDILKINTIYGVRCFLRKNKQRLRNGKNKRKEQQRRNGRRRYAAVAE